MAKKSCKKKLKFMKIWAKVLCVEKQLKVKTSDQMVSSASETVTEMFALLRAKWKDLSSLSSTPVDTPATLTSFAKLLRTSGDNDRHWPVCCRTSASPTAQGRTQGSMFTLSCAFPSSLPSGTSLPSWSCIGTGARSPSTSATRRSVWPRQNKPRVGGWNCS